MKIVSLAVLLLLSGVAAANPVDPYGPFGAPPPAAQAHKRAAKAELRQFLLRYFDVDQDGRLQPHERRRAAKALHRVAAKLVRGEQRARGHKHMRQRRLIRRFDSNRDGNVGPGEMPPSIADELRPLDRDGDGWLHGDELP